MAARPETPLLAGGGGQAVAGSVLPSRPAAPTLESVAEVAGVSRATASRVLTGASNVSERARTAVTEAAAKLGYLPNLAARSLVTRRSDSIGFVVSEPEERFFTDPFFSTVLRGAHSTMAQHRMQLVLSILSTPADREYFERFARGGHLDGAIFLSLHGPDPLPALLRASGVPVVRSGRPHYTSDVTPYVDADNEGGARSATRALVERGCRRIATITGPADMTAAQDRLLGFRAELATTKFDGRQVHVVESDFTLDGGARAMAQLLDTDPEIDGVFAANDLMAVGAMRVIADHSLVIPDDIAVVGFDDVAIATAVHPQLTTVRQPMVQMGEHMARVLLETLDGGDASTSVVLQTELIRRQST